MLAWGHRLLPLVKAGARAMGRRLAAVGRSLAEGAAEVRPGRGGGRAQRDVEAGGGRSGADPGRTKGAARRRCSRRKRAEGRGEAAGWRKEGISAVLGSWGREEEIEGEEMGSAERSER